MQKSVASSDRQRRWMRRRWATGLHATRQPHHAGIHGSTPFVRSRPDANMCGPSLDTPAGDVPTRKRRRPTRYGAEGRARTGVVRSAATPGCHSAPSNGHLSTVAREKLQICGEKIALLCAWNTKSRKERKRKERKIYLRRTITVSNKKNKETILKLARSRLPEKQKAIYAGCQHC